MSIPTPLPAGLPPLPEEQTGIPAPPRASPATMGERRAFVIGDPVIELRNVTVATDDGHKILDDVSLTCYEGEILGLVFARGQGKTTLLRVASGFFPPTSGQVLWRGKDVAKLGFQEQLDFQWKTGFVFQNGGLLVNTKIHDNVALPLRYRSELTDEEIAARVDAALGSVGMAHMAQRFPYEMSVGRQKLATLARALVREPDIIFYDNFVKGTEQVVWQALTRLVRWLRSNKRTSFMLVLETDPSTYAIADRLCVIEDGKILATSEPEKLRASGDVRVSRVFRSVDFNATEDDEKPSSGGS